MTWSEVKIDLVLLLGEEKQKEANEVTPGAEKMGKEREIVTRVN